MPEESTHAELSAVYAHAPFAMMLVDRGLIAVKVNPYAAMLAGRSLEDMTGKLGGEAIGCLHHLESPKGCGYAPVCHNCAIRIAVLKTFSDHKSRENLEAWLTIARGGEKYERCLLVSMSYLEDDGPERVLICALDITERKLAEEKLIQSEKQFKFITDNVTDIVWTLDLNLRTTFVSPSIERILGFTPEERMKQSLEEMIAPDSLRIIQRTFAEELQGATELPPDKDRYVLMEVEYYRRDGSTVWLENNMKWMRDHNGAITGIYGVSRDVTERRRVEDALRESEERWQFALEGSGDGVWDWNAQTNEVFYSRQWKAMLGFQEQEIGNTVLEWDKRIHPDDRKYVYSELNKHFQGLTPVYVTEHRVRCKDGSYKWILDRGKVIVWSPEGKPIRVIGTHTDITDRKQAEDERIKLETQLIQAQKMESVGRLAGGVAHDYNNMLGVIIGHAELALVKVGKTDPVRGDLEQILKAAERSADITRQLLAFARKQTISPRVLDLNDIVGGMLKILRRLIGENLELAWVPGMDLWPVKMDPAQLDQILANLCVNAKDAIDGKGRIVIETGNVSLDEAYCEDHTDSVPGQYVMLSVSDNGCGMDKETLDHLFEPFFTTKDVGKGTGLGLSTVYGIVKQNDGFINVYSEPGKGATFKIYLPRQEGKVEERRQSQGPILKKGRGETVLLVEDDIGLLEISKSMLERLGYRVMSTQSPQEALFLSERYADKIHLLMTDVVMPGMDGRELAEKLQALRPGLRTLFMSGYTAEVIVHHGLLDHGVKFISKPFPVMDLAAKLREVLDGQD